MMLTSELLFEKLKCFEGLRLEAYEDEGGKPTIGYGHTYNVKMGDKISELTAEELLKKDIEIAERNVLELGICKYQGQLDALVSFVFNLGIGNLKRSTLLKAILAGFGREVIGKEFRRWAYCNGKRMGGLVSRRRWEVERYFENTDSLDEVKQKMILEEGKFHDD